MVSRPLNRRRMLGLVCTAGLAVVSGCSAPPTRDRAETSSLHFLDTPFEAENTRLLLAEFQKRNPGVLVERQEVSADRLLTDLIAVIASGSALDLTLVPAGALARLAAARWVRDFGTVIGTLNGAGVLDQSEVGWVREQTSLNGIRYGAPAWVRLHGFFHNRTYLEATNQPAPTTFDDLRAAAEFIQRQHLGNYAFFWPLKNGPGILADDYLADGSRFFDAQLSPAFANDPRYGEVLDWRSHAVWDWNLVDPRGLNSEQDADDSFPHGWAAFSWGTYDQLRYWQTSGTFLQSGHLANGLVPSRSAAHVAIGAADLYAIPATTQQPMNAWELLYYLSAGENYRAARLRWTTSGLFFGFAPLIADQALLGAADDWADLTVLRQQLTQICPPPGVAVPWRDQWMSFAKIQSALLIRRGITPTTFIQRIAEEWRELQKGWSANPH